MIKLKCRIGTVSSGLLQQFFLIGLVAQRPIEAIQSGMANVVPANTAGISRHFVRPQNIGEQ